MFGEKVGKKLIVSKYANKMFNSIKDKNWTCEIIEGFINCKRNNSQMDVVKFLGNDIHVKGYIKHNEHLGKMVLVF